MVGLNWIRFPTTDSWSNSRVNESLATFCSLEIKKDTFSHSASNRKKTRLTDIHKQTNITTT